MNTNETKETCRDTCGGPGFEKLPTSGSAGGIGTGRLPVLGITGGVGAGKSTVLAWLRDTCGARVIEADEVGRLVQRPGEDCFLRIAETFGPEILAEDGTLDRGKLAALVFENPSRLQQLNRIVHPAVRAYIEKELEAEQRRRTVPFLVIEAALLLEEHYDLICDEVWYIYADEQTRTARLTQSRGYSERKTRRIMQNQMSEGEFRRRCSVVIDNSSSDRAEMYRSLSEAAEKFCKKNFG